MYKNRRLFYAGIQNSMFSSIQKCLVGHISHSKFSVLVAIIKQVGDVYFLNMCDLVIIVIARRLAEADMLESVKLSA